MLSLFLTCSQFHGQMCEAIQKANIKSEASVLWLFHISLGAGSIHSMDFTVTRTTPGFLGNWALDLRCLKTIKRSRCSNCTWNREKRESSRRNRAAALRAFLLKLLERKLMLHFPTGIGVVRREQKPYFFICNPKTEKYVQLFVCFLFFIGE